MLNYSYDAEGRLAAVNGSTSYRYGPESERVATVQAGAVTAEYLYGIDGGLRTTLAPGGKLVRGLVYGAGLHLADYTQSGKTVFHLADEVGSLVNTIDQTGAAIESCAANPFGESLNCSPSVDYTENHFTDKKRDQESGLDYFGARYYGSTFGRFMSPDWATTPKPLPYSNLDNPQSLNLYTYAMNNPLSMVDDDGHFSKDSYVADNDKHGGPHIDRYNKKGQNVGRYKPDGTPLEHKGNIPDPVPRSDEGKFEDAKKDLNKQQMQATDDFINQQPQPPKPPLPDGLETNPIPVLSPVPVTPVPLPNSEPMPPMPMPEPIPTLVPELTPFPILVGSVQE